MTYGPSRLADLKVYLLASDPGLQRLRAALRSVFGLGLTLVLTLPIVKISGQSITLAFLGGVLAMLGSLMVADPQPEQQRLTQLLLPIPVMISLGLGIGLSPWKQASLLCFVGLSFIAVAMRRWGPRYFGLGMMSLMSFFFTLFFKLPPAALPWACLVSILASAVMYALRFWIFRERPERLLKLSLAGFEARLCICLEALARLLRAPDITPKRWHNLQKNWLRLGEQAQSIENLSADNPSAQAQILKRQLHEQELAIGRLIETSWILRQSGSLALRARCAELMLQLCRVLRDPHDLKFQHAEHAIPSLKHKLNQLKELANAQTEPLLTRVLLSQFEAINQCLNPGSGPLAEQTDALKNVLTDKFTVDPAPDKNATSPQDRVAKVTGLHSATRQAIQASFATGLASLAGGALAPDYWAWGALSAFVIFLGSTRGNYLLRAWQRVFGTALGLGSGMLLAYLLTRAPGVEIALLLLSVFGGIYLIKVAYAWAMFCFSAQVALLYSLMGKLTPELMQLRLLETLIGAACGALVAVLVLPTRTRAAVRQALAEAFDQVSQLLGSLPDLNTPQLLDQTRALDAKVRELHDLATPLLDLRLPQGSLRLRGILQDLQHISYYLRQLANQHDSASAVSSQIQALAAKSEHLAEALRHSPKGQAAEPLLLGSLLLDSLPLPATTVPLHHWLTRVDQLLIRLAQRLELDSEL